MATVADPHGHRHTITALVQDNPGVLTRVASLVRRRGINIASLSVGHSELPNFSRLTFVLQGDDYAVEQAAKQLYKLIEVVRVSEFTEEEIVARELALVKVRTTPSTRSEVIQLVEIFRADIVDVSAGALVIEVTGDEEKIDALIKLLRPFGIREIMRSGRLAMKRGPDTLSREEKAARARGRSNGAQGGAEEH